MSVVVVEEVVSSEPVPPQWRPLDIPRVADCRNCGARIYARVGDTLGPWQMWRHVNRVSWGSSWCVLDPEAGVYTMADPDLATLEWVRDLITVKGTVGGYHAHWTVEIPFYTGRHRA